MVKADLPCVPRSGILIMIFMLLTAARSAIAPYPQKALFAAVFKVGRDPALSGANRRLATPKAWARRVHRFRP
jgi:hypothetical protein